MCSDTRVGKKKQEDPALQCFTNVMVAVFLTTIHISKEDANHFKGTGKLCSIKAHRGRLCNSNEDFLRKLKRRQISHSPNETSTSSKSWQSLCSNVSIKTVKNAHFWSTSALFPIAKWVKDLAALNCPYRLFYNVFILWIHINLKSLWMIV